MEPCAKTVGLRETIPSWVRTFVKDTRYSLKTFAGFCQTPAIDKRLRRVILGRIPCDHQFMIRHRRYYSCAMYNISEPPSRNFIREYFCPPSHDKNLRNFTIAKILYNTDYSMCMQYNSTAEAQYRGLLSGCPHIDHYHSVMSYIRREPVVKHSHKHYSSDYWLVTS